jgi:hypothetical protein
LASTLNVAKSCRESSASVRCLDYEAWSVALVVPFVGGHPLDCLPRRTDVSARAAVAFVNPAAVFSCIAYRSFQQSEVSLGAHGNLSPRRTRSWVAFTPSITTAMPA